MRDMVLVAMAAIAAPAIAAGDRAFDFMTLDTSTPYKGEMMVAGKKCKITGVGEEGCARYAGALVGTVPIIDLRTMFNNGKLFAIRGTTSGVLFPRLSEAFSAKYGKPTRTETPKWQNKMGAVFDNVVETWDFQDGVLELRAMGDMRDMTQFAFVANRNLPERPAQPVNF